MDFFFLILVRKSAVPNCQLIWSGVQIGYECMFSDEKLNISLGNVIKKMVSHIELLYTLYDNYSALAVESILKQQKLSVLLMVVLFAFRIWHWCMETSDLTPVFHKVSKTPHRDFDNAASE